MITGNGLPRARDCHAIERERTQAVNGLEGQRACGSFTIGSLIATRGLRPTYGQAGFLDLACRNVEHTRQVADTDHQIRCRRITVAIGQGVTKNIRDITRRTRVAGVTVVAVGINGKHTVLAGDGDGAGRVHSWRVTRRVGAGNRGNGRAVRTLGIRTRRTRGTSGGNDIAGLGTKTAGGHGIAVVAGQRFVVDDVDGERSRAFVAIRLGNDNGEVVLGRITRRRRGQRVAVRDRSVARDRIKREAGHRQRAMVANNGLRRLSGHRRHYGHPVDGDALQAVLGIEGNHAGTGFAIRGRIAADGQSGFVDLRTRHVHGDSCVADIDRQIGSRRVAIGVGKHVAEGFRHAAWRARIACVSIFTVGLNGEHAILPGHRDGSVGIHRRRILRHIVAGNPGYFSCCVSARGVSTRRTAGCARAGDDVAGSIRAAGCDGVGIVARGRYVVDDIDHQLAGRGAAISIRHDDIVRITGSIARRALRQGIAVGDGTVAGNGVKAKARNRQDAMVTGNLLASLSGQRRAVERHAL